MARDEQNPQGRPVRMRRMLAMLSLGVCVAGTASGAAQSTPPFVVTTLTTLASYTVPPQVNGNPLIQGAGFGTLAVNRLGDVFIGAYNSNAVYEFPANGAAPIAVYLSSSGGHAGAVTLDANQNLIVSERFLDAVYMIPYFNSTYTPYTYSSTNTYGPPPKPAACSSATATAGDACTYAPNFYENPGGGGSVTGYYYQVLALASDANGNFYMTTAYDNEGSNNIYQCTPTCIFGTDLPTLLLHWTQHVDSIAVDASGDVFFADGSTNLYELKPGATTPTTLSKAFLQAQGVGLDSAGNLYVSDLGTPDATTKTNDGAAIYEVPLEEGSLNPADTFMVVPYIFSPQFGGYDGPVNIGVIGVALDLHGNIFATQGYNNLSKYTVDNATFATTAIGATSAASTLTITFDKATSLKLTAVAAAGVASSEFAVVTSGTDAGTCAIGTAYKTGEYCTLAVTFTPAKSGLRTAMLNLTDADGETVSVYLSGTGTGEAVTVDPGTQTAIGTGLKTPSAVAVDAAGNVFVADSGANAVYEFAGGTGSGTAVGSGLRSPGGVAVDAGGNLYISDTGNDRVVMIPSSGGALATAQQSTLVTDVKSPGQLAVDASGTLYIPETANDDVLAFVSRPGLANAALTTQQVTGLKAPASVAVDASGRIYVTDTGNNRIVEFADGAVSTIGTTLSAPAGVALDASGSLLIADEGNGRIVRVPNEKGVLTSSDQITINTTIAGPHAIATDTTGNVIAADPTHAAAYAINRVAGSLDFGRVNGGSSSVSETVVLSSAGTEDLTFGKQLFPPLPSDSPFSVTSPSGGGCVGLTVLAAGSSCTLSTLFAPSKAIEGEQNYTVNFSTGAQNASAASLALSGDAVNLTVPAVSLVQTSPGTGAASYGTPVTVKANVTRVSGVFGTPTGMVTFIVDGANGQPQALDAAGSALLTMKGLSGGSHTVAASYSGDDHYAPEASKTLTITITPDSSATLLTVVGYAVNPLTAEPPNPTNTGDQVTMTAVVAPSVPGSLSGEVDFTSGGNLLGTATVIGTTSGAKTIYTAVLTTTTLAAGNYNIVANFMGNSNYVGSSSGSTALIVSPPKFVLAESSSTVTSSQTGAGSTSISVTSYSGFTGAVEFSCSGLPAYSTCQFVPAVLPLTANTTGSAEINVPVLSTQVSVLVDQPPLVTPTGIFWWSGLLLGLSLFGLASNRNARRKLMMRGAAGVMMLAALSGLASCGGNASFTTPTGTSTVTVTATASPTGALSGKDDVVQTITFTLNVK